MMNDRFPTTGVSVPQNPIVRIQLPWIRSRGSIAKWFPAGPQFRVVFPCFKERLKSKQGLDDSSRGTNHTTGSMSISTARNNYAVSSAFDLEFEFLMLALAENSKNLSSLGLGLQQQQILRAISRFREWASSKLSSTTQIAVRSNQSAEMSSTLEISIITTLTSYNAKCIRSSTLEMESCTSWRLLKGALQDLIYRLQSQSNVYWITGEFGSGKSTLMKYFHNSSTNIGSALVAWTDTFHAKEELRFNITYSSFDKLPSLPQYKMIANETNLSPGDPETIWNSMASHLPQGEPQCRCKPRFSFTPTQEKIRVSHLLQLLRCFGMSTPNCTL